MKKTVLVFLIGVLLSCETEPIQEEVVESCCPTVTVYKLINSNWTLYFDGEFEDFFSQDLGVGEDYTLYVNTCSGERIKRGFQSR